MPLRVGVSGDVQPVPAPALSISRGREQPVHDAFERLGRIITHRTRPISSSEGGIPRRSSVARRRRVRLSAGGAGLQPGRFELGQDEPVDGRSGPLRVDDLRRSRDPRGLERPELAAGRFPFWAGCQTPWTTVARGIGGGRPGRPHLDPCGEHIDIGLAELLLRRHRHVALVADGEDQQALVRFSANDRRTGYSAFQERLQRIDAQLRLAVARIGPVAAIAVLGQDRSDPALEEPGGRRRPRVEPDVFEADVADSWATDRHARMPESSTTAMRRSTFKDIPPAHSQHMPTASDAGPTGAILAERGSRVAEDFHRSFRTSGGLGNRLSFPPTVYGRGTSRPRP